MRPLAYIALAACLGLAAGLSLPGCILQVDLRKVDTSARELDVGGGSTQDKNAGRQGGGLDGGGGERRPAVGQHR